jgi:hypothetical protein
MRILSIESIPTESIAIDLIDPIEFNPAFRTTESALRGLEKDVEEMDGVIISPIILIPKRGRYVVVDGNRRWNIAKKRGYKNIDCRILNVPIEKAPRIWANLNRGGRKVSALEWMSAYYNTNGEMEEEIAHHIRSRILHCKKIFGGMEGLNFLLSAKPPVAPTIAATIIFLDNRMQKLPSTYPPHSQRVIGKWMVHRKTLGLMSTCLGSKANPLSSKILQKIWRHIRDDKTFTIKDLLTKNGDSVR